MTSKSPSAESSPSGHATARPIRLPGPVWTFLALIILFAMALGIGVGIPYYRERQVEARLRSLNAICSTKIVAPNWLRSIVGDRRLWAFRRIHDVTWNFSTDVQLEDDELVILEGLTNLQRLSLNRTRVGDDALTHLEGLHLLKVLQLVDTEITDEGIKHLEKLTELERLDLWRTHVTEEGIKRLRALPKLRSIHPADARSDMW